MLNSTSQTVSLLVPTYNRAEVIARIWPSWLALPELAEIVLVNDGSTQDYSELIKTLATACERRGKRFVYVRNLVRMGSPAAKNKGLQECTQPFVLTTDDDIDLDSRMLSQMLTTAAEHPGSLIGARVVYRKDGETCQQAHARSDREPATEYFNVEKLTVLPWLRLATPIRVPFVTAVALWPRTLFDKGLRWFEDYGGNGYREETDPQIEAQSGYGAEIWYDSAAVCYHLPPSEAYASKSGQRRGGFFWFEYWVVRNNWVFLTRHQQWLLETLGIRRRTAIFALISERFGPRRAGVLVKRIKQRLMPR